MPEWLDAALIIPSLNEEPVIAATLARVPHALFALVIVADNGSTDRTAEVARAAGATVTRASQRGYGAACLAAIDELPANIGVVCFLQADGSEDPAEAARLLAPIREGRADLVIGSRVLGGAAAGALLPHQIFGNALATRMIRLLYGHRYTDLGPFRAIRVDALRTLRMQSRTFGWTVEMQVRALEERLHVVEVPVSYSLRRAGENKISGNLRASLRAGSVILTTVLRLWVARQAARWRK